MRPTPSSSFDSNKPITRTVGARGRIQNIIADARASLKEPSRPITPQTLDQRTLLLGGQETRDNRDQIAASYNAVLRSKKGVSSSLSSYSSYKSERDSGRSTTAVSSSTDTYSQRRADSRQCEITTQSNNREEFVYDDEEDEESESDNEDDCEDDEREEQRVEVDNTLSQRSLTTAIQSAVRDAQVTERSHTLHQRQSSAAAEAQLSLKEFLQRVRAVRASLLDAQRSPREQESALDTLRSVSESLMESVKNSKGTRAALSAEDLGSAHSALGELVSSTETMPLSQSVKRRLLTLSLRLCVHTFPTDTLPDTPHNSPTQPTQTTPLCVLESLSHALHTLHTTQSAQPSDTHRESERERDVARVAVETTQLALAQLVLLLDREYKQNSGPTMSSRVIGNTLVSRLYDSVVYTQWCGVVAYSAATLRALSSESDSSRLAVVSAKAVDGVCVRAVRLFERHAAMHAMLAVYAAAYTERDKEKEREAERENARETVTERETEREKKESRRRVSSVLRHTTSALTQVLGLLRNLTADTNARAALASQPALTSRLCLCLSLYRRASPEVALNIARILAKLSLYETFRAHISAANTTAVVYVAGTTSGVVPRPSSSSGRLIDNSMSNNVTRNGGNVRCMEALLGMIQSEAALCRRVMERCEGEEEDSEDSESEEEVRSWPAWHTWPVVSRVAFTLGNLTTTNELNRSVLGASSDGVASILLLLRVCVSTLTRIHTIKQQQRNRAPTTTVFAFGNTSLASNPYVSLDVEENDEEVSVVDEEAYEEVRDAAVKLVRAFANLCIDSTVGLSVAATPTHLQTLLEILTICDDSPAHEELLLNTIAALTNLTYYTCQLLSETHNAITRTLDQKTATRLDHTLVSLATQLSSSLFHENAEIVLEACRVLGNLTRRVVVIETLITRRVYEALLMLLLQHIQRDVVCAVCGVIVNFSSHVKGRQCMLQLCEDGGYVRSVYCEDIVNKLVSRLRTLTMQDIHIAMLIGQILHNLIGSNEFSDYRQHNAVPVERIELTLTEWMDIAEDLLHDHSDAEQGGFSEEDVQNYKQFSRIAHSVIALLTNGESRK